MIFHLSWNVGNSSLQILSSHCNQISHFLAPVALDSPPNIPSSSFPYFPPSLLHVHSHHSFVKISDPFLQPRNCSCSRSSCVSDHVIDCTAAYFLIVQFLFLYYYTIKVIYCGIFPLLGCHSTELCHWPLHAHQISYVCTLHKS